MNISILKCQPCIWIWLHAEELKQIISQENIGAKLGAYNKEKANEDLFK